MNRNQAKRNRSIRSQAYYGYVYASYVNDRGTGAIAVIDPGRDEIIDRIPSGSSPSAMCTDYYRDNLYVTDDRTNTFTVYSRYDHKQGLTRRIGTSSESKPVAVIVEPAGKKAYVANFGDRCVTIIDLSTKDTKNVPMVTSQPGSQGRPFGRPFAFTVTENSPFVYVACKYDYGNDFVVAIDLEDDTAYSLDFDYNINYDETRNPLTIHPNTYTLASLGDTGVLNYIGDRPGGYNSTSLLDNTVSGAYLYRDNLNLLFCTMREDKNKLKLFENLAIDSNRNITYERFLELPSYKGQDKIRVSAEEMLIGVTVQPTLLPTGGLQIINTHNMASKFYPLDVVRDMTFFAYDKAYVAEINSVRPIDLQTGQVKPSIQIGGNDITVRNLIYDYNYQST